jgi:hypothetical protein
MEKDCCMDTCGCDTEFLMCVYKGLLAVDLQELGITIDINNMKQLQDELIRLGYIRKVVRDEIS